MGTRRRQLLHGKYLEAWETFAERIGGQWSGTVSDDDARIEVPHPYGPITIESDVSMIMVGKVMMPVYSTIFSALRPTDRRIRFSVSRADFATSVAEWFGSLDIQVDDPDFDKAFVLKGETPDFVRRVFASETLRARYLMDFEGSLALKDDKGMLSDPTPGLDPLELTVSGLLDDAGRMERLYRVFAGTLEGVVVSAPDAPGDRPHTP